MTTVHDIQRLMRADDNVAAAPERASDIRPAPAGAESQLGQLLRKVQEALADELIARIHANTPEFFEQLVIDVLSAMGYGSPHGEAGQRLGRSHDGGIDGLVALDALGLDHIYIQAKRLKPGVAVPVAEVRDFAGSLEARHAGKGVFVTTTHFSPGAVEFCSRISRRLVLVDGQRLAGLMMRYNIGVRVQQSYEIKLIDPGYFSPLSREGPRPSRGPV